MTAHSLPKRMLKKLDYLLDSRMPVLPPPTLSEVLRDKELFIEMKDGIIITVPNGEAGSYSVYTRKEFMEFHGASLSDYDDITKKRIGRLVIALFPDVKAVRICEM